MAAVELARRVRSLPLVSSKTHWLRPAPSSPWLCQPLSTPAWLASPFSPADQGGRSASLYSWPATTGWSISPSINSTMTSVPPRGRWCAPQLGPACELATRSQVPERSSPGALPLASPWVRWGRPPVKGFSPRCHGNCTFTRKSRSDVMGASLALTTTAARPSGAVGRGRQTGINAAASGCARKRLRYVPRSMSGVFNTCAAWPPRLLVASCVTSSKT
ncbi:Uncharacterised protein [Achromobacter kerstersii]|nr:Uncharacterised protein [Achromobacter kerstersii]